MAWPTSPCIVKVRPRQWLLWSDEFRRAAGTAVVAAPGKVLDLRDQLLWNLVVPGQESKLDVVTTKRGDPLKKPPSSCWTEEDAPMNVRRWLDTERLRLSAEANPPRGREGESPSGSGNSRRQDDEPVAAPGLDGAKEKSRSGDIAAAIAGTNDG